jgi:hypothetical protein
MKIFRDKTETSKNKLAWVTLVTLWSLMALSSQQVEAREGAYEGAGGPALIGALIDFKELAESFRGLVNIKGDITFDGKTEIYLMGAGGGFGGDDIRLGGFGGGGHWSFGIGEKAEFDRVTLELGWGGFMMDQVLVDGRLGAVTVGMVLGGGGWTLQVSKDAQGNFGDLIVKPPLYLELHRSFWMAMPFASIELKILEFMGVRLGGGYWLSLSTEEWKFSDDRTAPGGPLKTMIFPVFQLMVIFGG